MLALRAFKGSQIGAVRTRFDADQHHAALTLRATRPLDRKERWFGTCIRSRHGMHRYWWRGHNTLSHRKSRTWGGDGFTVPPNEDPVCSLVHTVPKLSNWGNQDADSATYKSSTCLRSAPGCA
jgi:hypothetical protein